MGAGARPLPFFAHRLRDILQARTNAFQMLLLNQLHNQLVVCKSSQLSQLSYFDGQIKKTMRQLPWNKTGDPFSGLVPLVLLMWFRWSYHICTLNFQILIPNEFGLVYLTWHHSVTV
jgi:hypothetical protein